MSGALAVMSQYNLEPSKRIDGWSQFARTSSAGALMAEIPVGRYLEIFDNKFQGESLILFRRKDFDHLNMLSSMASKVSRFLMQIDRITTTYTDTQDPRSVIQLIHEEARMGIEYTVVRSTSSASEYFGSTLNAPADFADTPLPTSKKKRSK